MSRFTIKVLKFVVCFFDITIIALTYVLALHMRFGTEILSENKMPIMGNLPYLILAYVIFYYIYGLYSVQKKSVREHVVSIFIVSSIMMVISMALVFFQRDFGFPRSIFIIAYVLQIAIMLPYRLTVHWVRLKVNGKEKVSIIGSKSEIESLVREIINNRNWYVLDKLIFLEEGKPVDKNYELALLGSDVVYIGSKVEMDYLNRLVETRKTIFKLPSLSDVHMKNSSFQSCGDIPIYYIPSLQVSKETLMFKHILDLLIVIPATILLMPLLIFISVAIKLDSKGPVIYKQERLTYLGRKFNVYKFRSMYEDAELKTGPVLATERDPRITRVGAFIRKTRIDELPQLFNVLLGDMSLVGPRPEREYFVSEIIKELPEFEYRTSVKAGITGLAQVYGRYTTTNQDKLIYDLMYIRDCSVLSDLIILLKTIRVVFYKESALGSTQSNSLELLLSDAGYKVTQNNSIWSTTRI